MKAIYKSLIHILIASLILVPFSLNAAMISTDKAFKTEQSVENKNKVEFFNRTDQLPEKSYPSANLDKQGCSTSEQSVNK